MYLTLFWWEWSYHPQLKNIAEFQTVSPLIYQHYMSCNCYILSCTHLTDMTGIFLQLHYVKYVHSTEPTLLLNVPASGFCDSQSFSYWTESSGKSVRYWQPNRHGSTLSHDGSRTVFTGDGSEKTDLLQLLVTNYMVPDWRIQKAWLSVGLSREIRLKTHYNGPFGAARFMGYILTDVPTKAHCGSYNSVGYSI